MGGLQRLGAGYLYLLQITRMGDGLERQHLSCGKVSDDGLLAAFGRMDVGVLAEGENESARCRHRTVGDGAGGGQEIGGQFVAGIELHVLSDIAVVDTVGAGEAEEGQAYVLAVDDCIGEGYGVLDTVAAAGLGGNSLCYVVLVLVVVGILVGEAHASEGVGCSVREVDLEVGGECLAVCGSELRLDVAVVYLFEEYIREAVRTGMGTVGGSHCAVGHGDVGHNDAAGAVLRLQTHGCKGTQLAGEVDDQRVTVGADLVGREQLLVGIALFGITDIEGHLGLLVGTGGYGIVEREFEQRCSVALCIVGVERIGNTRRYQFVPLAGSNETEGERTVGAVLDALIGLGVYAGDGEGQGLTASEVALVHPGHEGVLEVEDERTGIDVGAGLDATGFLVVLRRIVAHLEVGPLVGGGVEVEVEHQLSVAGVGDVKHLAALKVLVREFEFVHILEMADKRAAPTFGSEDVVGSASLDGDLLLTGVEGAVVVLAVPTETAKVVGHKRTILVDVALDRTVVVALVVDARRNGRIVDVEHAVLGGRVLVVRV